MIYSLDFDRVGEERSVFSFVFTRMDHIVLASIIRNFSNKIAFIVSHKDCFIWLRCTKNDIKLVNESEIIENHDLFMNKGIINWKIPSL